MTDQPPQNGREPGRGTSYNVYRVSESPDGASGARRVDGSQPAAPRDGSPPPAPLEPQSRHTRSRAARRRRLLLRRLIVFGVLVVLIAAIAGTAWAVLGGNGGDGGSGAGSDGEPPSARPAPRPPAAWPKRRRRPRRPRRPRRRARRHRDRLGRRHHAGLQVRPPARQRACPLRHHEDGAQTPRPHDRQPRGHLLHGRAVQVRRTGLVGLLRVPGAALVRRRRSRGRASTW